MPDRYRVLFVPGSGDLEPETETETTWRARDVGVGLERALPADLLTRLDVDTTTHERVLRAMTVVTTTVAPGGRDTSAPGSAADCPCCAKGGLSRLLNAVVARAPALLGFVERQYVRLLQPDVARFAGDPELRAAVSQQVHHDLELVNPHIVLAHSLGAVVAIEALAVSEWSPQLLITAGAPFAWPRFAQTWSREAGGWLSRKPCLWINLVDLSDQVTGFQVPSSSPYSNARNVVVGNDQYSTFFGPDGGISRNHSLRHYLRHTAVREAFLKVCA